MSIFNFDEPYKLRCAIEKMDRRFVEAVRKVHPELNCTAPAPVAVASAPVTTRRTYGAVVSLIGKPSWETIVQLCALRFRVTFADIIGKDQRHGVAAARVMAMALCHSHCDLSGAELARRFKRDPTTVLHVVRRLQNKALKPAKGELVG